jgi:hypothetical protein
MTTGQNLDALGIYQFSRIKTVSGARLLDPVGQMPERGKPSAEIPGKADLVAVFAAIGPLFGVYQVKDMGDVGLGGGDTPGIFADQDVFHPFRELKFDLAGDFFVFYDIHRNIGIDKAEDVQVYGDGVVDLDNVLAAHVFRTGVYHKGHGIGGLAEAEPVEDPNPQARFNMIDDDTVFYFGDI